MLPICERAAEVRGGEDAATDVVAKGHERSNWSPSCCRLCSMLANFLPAEYAAELQLTDASRAQSQRRNLIGREPPIREDSRPSGRNTLLHSSDRFRLFCCGSPIDSHVAL